MSLIGLSQSPWLVRDLDGVGKAPAQVSRTTMGPFVARPLRRRRQRHAPWLRTPPAAAESRDLSRAIYITTHRELVGEKTILIVLVKSPKVKWRV